MLQKITALFGRKDPKKRVGEPRSIKRKMGGTPNNQSSTKLRPAPENSMAKKEKAKSKTKIKSVQVQAFHKKKKADWAKIFPVYLCKVQKL